MAKYKYIVKQAHRYNDEADNKCSINMEYLVGSDVEASWSSATSSEEGDVESNARLLGSVVDDQGGLTVTGGSFSVSDGVDTSTVFLDGDENSIVDIMDKIDDALQTADMDDMHVKGFTVEWPEENKSYLEIFSKGTPGTSDEITIATTTATLSQFGLVAGSTYGTKPDKITVNKIYLGGLVASVEEGIDNPVKPKITENWKTGDSERFFALKVRQVGHVDNDNVPLIIDKTTYSYVETEYNTDSTDDGVAESTFVDGSLQHNFKVRYNEELSRYDFVSSSSEEKDAELDYIEKYEKFIDRETDALIKEWCVSNVGNEEKAINLGIQKSLTDDLSAGEETMWSDYQSYRSTVVASQRAKKVAAMIKEAE